ncbi:MAG: D-cysteine desulfhydrase family protein [Pseudomonadales bacterium]|nr:D-cysteine desulfhydrase family protein [Pseudomonadales bacterium]
MLSDHVSKLALAIANQIPRISLARLPTPLVPLRRFSKKHNTPTIWLKRDDLTDTAASGNKLRKLEFVLGHALAEGATTIITCGGIQSNHCRATAVVASQLGLKCHLILRGKPTNPADGNLLLDELVGAKITFIDTSMFSNIDQIFTDLANEYRQLGEVPYAIPVGASDEIGLWGYIDAIRELKIDFDTVGIQPKYLFSATGSGGTAGGLILGRQIYGLPTEIYSVNVCDDEAYFINKISDDFSAWRQRYGIEIANDQLPINILDGYVGPGYGKAEPKIFDLIQDLARTEGMILDPVYTAKAFYGMLTELNKGRFTDCEDIIFIHTGGIFGLFPQKEQFTNSSLTQ